MSKQTSYEKQIVRASETALQVGAWALAVTAMLAATERLHHINHHSAASTHSSHVAEAPPAKAEAIRETARMLEEYDVGLRAPASTGA
jgi:hypothetical protein